MFSGVEEGCIGNEWVVTFSLDLAKSWHLSALFLMKLLSNQVNEDFEASSNENIKLSISFTT